ncbi:hypothetical protein FRC17_002490 [Serendipita sp. 399]|nr:hypothetical protein FRC17_002490 [Serendipita sp. 399]
MLFTKDPKTQQPVDRSASGETESTVRTARNPRLQQLRANVILNDDIIYEILTIAAGTTNSDLQRREALSQYALVCQTWDSSGDDVPLGDYYPADGERAETVEVH